MNEVSAIPATEADPVVLQGGFDPPFYQSSKNLSSSRKSVASNAAGQLLNTEALTSFLDQYGLEDLWDTPKQAFTTIDWSCRDAEEIPVGLQEIWASLNLGILTPSPYKIPAHQRPGIGIQQLLPTCLSAGSPKSC